MYYLCAPLPPLSALLGAKTFIIVVTFFFFLFHTHSMPLFSPVLPFLDPVSPYTLINWHWKGVQKFFVLLSPPTWLTFCWEILCSLHRRIGRISNFKQFNICLFYRSKPEREMSFVYDPVVESLANDSWWQILWARLDLLVDPLEHLRLEDALLERDD